jgi:hypothetical protein
MTAVVLVSCYFVALATFLGLDIISKVPATLYPLVLAALGTVAAVSVVGGVLVASRATVPASGALGAAAAAVGAAAAGAGLASLARVVKPHLRRPHRS